MIVCKACGKENQDHYKFCLGCGAELTRPQKPEEQNMAMMKTMMADISQGGTTPTPPGGAKLPGMSPTPNPAPSGGPGGPPPGGPPPGGYGAGPSGPPPGVPTGSVPAARPYGAPGAPSGPPPGAPSGPPPGAPAGPGPGGFGQASGGFGQTPGTSPGGGYGQAPGPAAGGRPPASNDFESSPGTSPGSAFGQVPGTTPGTAQHQAPAADRPCPSCSTPVPPAFKFCGACGHRMEEISAPVSAPRSTSDYPETQAQTRSTLTLIRPDGSEGGTHHLQDGENKLGRDHGAIFENDGYLSPTHAELVVNAAGAVVRDLDSLNGVFVKMTDEEQIEGGQVLRLGQELLRFDFIEPPEPLEDGTEVMGSPNPGYWGKITVVIGDGVDGSAYPLLGDSVTMGRERGDINFPDDGYVSGLHARLSTRDGKVYLSDMGSSNGTFIKVQGERQIDDESFVLLGQQLFRLNLT
jgi:pSer/pThr/pTyr-binding forkhead associated (FHA) protein